MIYEALNKALELAATASLTCIQLIGGAVLLRVVR
jgi:hypothetical protein